MDNSKVKATAIKGAAALLSTLIITYGGITNTDKICSNKLEICKSSSSEKASDGSVVNEIDSVFDEGDNSAVGTDADAADNSDNSDVLSDSAADADISSSVSSSAVSSSGSSSSSSKNSKAAKKAITLTGGLTSSNVEEVLEYYKLVSKKNANLLFTKTLTLTSMNGGKNISQRMIDIFTPIAQKALAKNTITNEPYPGKPDKIKASDWQQAKAVNDGTYTTVYIKVVPQTDSYNGSEYEGTAGRTMGVLDGIDRALQDMGAVTVDFSKTKMKIEYINPYVKLKVKNATGELVKGECEWGYNTHPYIEAMDAKVIGFNIHLEGAGGYITYSVKY